MTEETSNIPSPFDVRTIKYLVGLMSRHDLSEIDLREGDLRIRLRRGAREVILPPNVHTPTASVPAGVPAGNSTPPPQQDKSSKELIPIKSPTPGTFYSAASPDAEPFVRVGSKVTPTSVVCVIEAMKIFNEIQAECTGVITEILVENQQPVEYGQVLFMVDPTG